jgi:hypothetical protein
MKQNLIKADARRQELERLQNHTNDLNLAAQSFCKSGSRMRKRKWSKELRMHVSDVGVHQKRGRRLIVLFSVQASLYT